MMMPPPGEFDPTQIKGSLYEVYSGVPPLDDRQLNPGTLFDQQEFSHPVFGVLNQYIAKYAPSSEPDSTDIPHRAPHILPRFHALLQGHVLRQPPQEVVLVTPQKDADIIEA